MGIADKFVALAVLWSTLCGAEAAVFMQAHRGGLDEVPENTMAAFEHAWSIPGAVPEMDLQTTRDGVIVLMHDDTPERTTNAPLPFARQSLAEIDYAETQRWDAGVKFNAKFADTRIPTLDAVFDVLKAHPERQAYLDLKTVDLAMLKKKIIDAKLEKQVIFVHGDIARCAVLKTLFPGARTMTWLSGSPGAIRAKYEAVNDGQLAGVTQLQFHLPVLKAGPPIAYGLDDDFLKTAVKRLDRLGVVLQLRPMKFDHESLQHLAGLGVRWFVADAPKAFREALDNATP